MDPALPYTFVVARQGPADETWEELLASLPLNSARYIVARFSIDGGRISALIFILWCPDAAPIKQKMIYASTKQSMKRSLVGISYEIAATDPSEIAREVIAERLTLTLVVKG